MVIGVIAVSLYNNIQFSAHVKKLIFDECFQYYAKKENESGVTKELTSLCWDKAEQWIKDIK